MLDWSSIRLEYDQILERLSDSASVSSKDRVDLQKRGSLLKDLLDIHTDFERIAREETEFSALVMQGDELADLYREELVSLKTQKLELEKKLEDRLYPADEHDNNSVFLEIRAGAGGLEAALFVGDLFRMYSMYAAARGWEVSIVDVSGRSIWSHSINGERAFIWNGTKTDGHSIARGTYIARMILRDAKGNSTVTEKSFAYSF